MHLKTININIGANLFALIIVLLLLFDRSFSKLAIIEPIYVHDVLLILATVFSLYNFPIKIKQPSILLLLIISLAYLVYSVFYIGIKEGFYVLVFRQYFLFFYLGCSYVIANKFYKSNQNIFAVVNFIKKLAIVSVILQLGYFCYLYITIPNYSPLVGFSYLSALGVMGIITFSAYVLVYYSGFLKWGLLAVTLLISAMLGHSSSFFAVFSILLIHFYISFSPKIRFISLGILAIIMILLLQQPQFTDANANWRLLYWQHIMEMAIFKNGMFLGNGFGKPYMTLEFAQFLVDEINSTFMFTGVNNEFERWVTPPHNSFLTIVHHIGLVPVLLLFIPLKDFFKQIFIRSKSNDFEELFLFYSLFGLIVWISFNVVLELPHSAIFFWMVYFTYIFYGKAKD